jgi:hypothetical protein
VAPVRNPIGANMSFRRDVFDEVGGFTDALGRLGSVPVSCDETELAIRARRRRRGSVVLHVPEARVEHAVPPERVTWRYLVWRCWAEGRSKALVTMSVGAQDSLASERSYVVRVLPRAVGRALRDALRGDRDGLRRAGAIVGALATTLTAYVYGRALGTHSRPVRSQ